jgi:hypothetical protein
LTRSFRYFGAIFGFALSLPAGAAGNDAPASATRAMLDSISAAKLRGDLSFLASDALRGRFTPSPELDIAAEFIASKFRSAGLEPGGNQEYFQTAEMTRRRMPEIRWSLRLQSGSQILSIPPQSISIRELSQPGRLTRVPVIFVKAQDTAKLTAQDLNGKAVLVQRPDFEKLSTTEKTAEARAQRSLDRLVFSAHAALEVIVGRERPPNMEQRLLTDEQVREQRVPIISVTSGPLWLWAGRGLRNRQHANLSLVLPAPDDQKVTVKNVVGILRGSDPLLRETCVLLTAHYDHIGTADTAGRLAMSQPKNESDRIFNGANDDGSGTVSVLEIAHALARLEPRPKRSLVFVTFFGEELGELGSEFYGKHPIFPAAKTVADINLEQLGRTDSSTGKQIATASATGYDYSDVTKYLEQAGAETGIRLYKDPEASDAYFLRSDNDALARVGIPAHTITVAFDFPDYHAVGDEWQKIDYENMARVDRMLALALVNLANSAIAPEWNAENPKTLPFREARKKLLAQ